MRRLAFVAVVGCWGDRVAGVHPEWDAASLQMFAADGMSAEAQETIGLAASSSPITFRFTFRNVSKPLTFEVARFSSASGQGEDRSRWTSGTGTVEWEAVWTDYETSRSKRLGNRTEVEIQYRFGDQPRTAHLVYRSR